MTTKEFIEKAIEGGAHYWGYTKESFPIDDFYVSTFLLKPESWQAVGKVEGWSEEENPGMEKTTYEGGGIEIKAGGYFARMIGMTAALLEGKTHEEYLTTL